MWLSKTDEWRAGWWRIDDKAAMQVCNRQVAKRWWFTLYATNSMEYWSRDLSIRAACRVYLLGRWHSKKFRSKGTRRPRLCSWDHHPFFIHSKSSCYVTFFELGELVVIKASSLSSEFRERASGAQYCSMWKSIKRHGLVHRMCMRIAQWDPRELKDISAAFMAMVRPMVTGAGRDKDYIINMDLICINLLTLELVGALVKGILVGFQKM